MGFRFRKSVGAGPFRLNISTSGVGWSVGGKGFRTGQSTRGRRYTTFSVPGSGVSYRTNHTPDTRGCLLPILFGASIIALCAWRTWT
jgi:hypothetical protein